MKLGVQSAKVKLSYQGLIMKIIFINGRLFRRLKKTPQRQSKIKHTEIKTSINIEALHKQRLKVVKIAA